MILVEGGSSIKPMRENLLSGKTETNHTVTKPQGGALRDQIGPVNIYFSSAGELEVEGAKLSSPEQTVLLLGEGN